MKKLLLGNEAVARGAYEAGVTVATAYPGTPSTEITENMAKYDEIYCEWSPNEKVALEVAIGASIAGARALCTMKHVGLNVAADPLFTVSYTGINGGLVIIVADDPGMHSSQNEQDSRNYARFAKLPMLEPSDSGECKLYVKKAFEISEKYDTPVLIRLNTRIAHSRTVVEIGDRLDYALKDYKKDAVKYVMMPAMARKRHLEVVKRMDRLTGYSEDSPLNSMELNDRKVGIITSGISYQYGKEVFPRASYLKLGMIHPLPLNMIREFSRQVDTLYVIEELDPFIEDEIRKLGIKVTGKDILPVTGEYSGRLLRERLLNEKFEDDAKGEELPLRPPVLCPGCPHRGVFYIFKKLKLVVTGDIGCYTLGALSPLEAMDTCICMGASIGMAHGMEMARGKDFARKTVAVIGDSTFIHSGITGLIDIVYNRGTSTVVVLDNSITGMTGHQHNPLTGFTIKGERVPQTDLIGLAKAIGIKRIRVTDPNDLKDFEKTIKEEIGVDEPSLVIAQRPCALLKTVKFPGPLRIDLEKCKLCKACMKIGCPAIMDRGTYMEVDQSLCVGCDLCTRVCNFDAFERSEPNG